MPKIDPKNRVVPKLVPDTLELIELIHAQYIGGGMEPKTALARLKLSKRKLEPAALSEQLTKAKEVALGLRLALTSAVAEKTGRPQVKPEVIETEILTFRGKELQEHKDLSGFAVTALEKVDANCKALGFSQARPVEPKPEEPKKVAPKVNKAQQALAQFVLKHKVLKANIRAEAIDPSLIKVEEPVEEVEEKPKGDFKTEAILTEDDNYLIVLACADTIERFKKANSDVNVFAELKGEFGEEVVIEAHRAVYEAAKAQLEVSGAVSEAAKEYAENVLAFIREIDEVVSSVEGAFNYFGTLLPSTQKLAPSTIRR